MVSRATGRVRTVCRGDWLTSFLLVSCVLTLQCACTGSTRASSARRCTAPSWTWQRRTCRRGDWSRVLIIIISLCLRVIRHCDGLALAVARAESNTVLSPHIVLVVYECHIDVSTDVLACGRRGLAVVVVVRVPPSHSVSDAFPRKFDWPGASQVWPERNTCTSSSLPALLPASFLPPLSLSPCDPSS